jgi:dTDP-4-dehydrorhamnose reductase
MWLIVGANGQLGKSLADVLQTHQIEFVAIGKDQLDITDDEQVGETIAQYQPSVIVNAAAWTKVDDAEDNEAAAYAVNCVGARNIAQVALTCGAQMIHISTDYVFDGSALSPIDETEPGTPIGAYGRTKWAGEQAVREVLPNDSLIVRTAWLYSQFGANFARTMTRRALGDQPVRVVNDQYGQPTLTSDLAEHLVKLVEHSVPAGTYHGTNSDQATWFEFAREIYALVGSDPGLVTPVPATEYPTRAVRPKYSVLSHTRTIDAGVKEMRHWQEALRASMPVIVSTIDQN